MVTVGLSAFELTLTEGSRLEKRLFHATFATVSVVTLSPGLHAAHSLTLVRLFFGVSG